MHPYGHTLMPLHLAKRMIEQRGGEWRTEQEPFMDLFKNGRYVGSVIIRDDAVKFLDLTGAFASVC